MATTAPSAHGPTQASTRNTNLDAVRGVAVLGILVMNIVSYGLGTVAYFNIEAGGSSNRLHWLVGAAGEVLVDQRFMGLFSLLFGAGIVLFADRAMAKGRRGGLLSLWRNVLLLVIGVLHALLWDGDVLRVYAVCAPVLILVRNLPARLLGAAGTVIFLLSPLSAVLAQSTIDASGAGLGDYWVEGGAMSDAVGLFLLVDFFARALGMMLIGVALYRSGVVAGDRSPAFYRRLAAWGLGIGIPLALAGFVWVAANDFDPSVAVIGAVPTSLGTIPAVLGYLAALILWNQRGDGGFRERVRAVGRMALTNYLSQTVIGIVVLRAILDVDDPGRGYLALLMIGIWALQLWWSPVWLARFRYGPAEWLWRCATYRSWQPIRR